MGTSYKQDREFLDSVIGEGLLESVIEWICANMEPEEVFDKDSLGMWAAENGFTMEEP